MNVSVLSSVSGLESIADEWDGLWASSGVTIPTAQAGLVRVWLEHFAPRQPFQMVIVRQDGRLVGAVPLVGQGWRRLLRWGTLPANHWARHGTLLIDPEVSATEVVTQIASAFSQLPWRALLFPAIRQDDANWLALIDACRVAGWRVLESPLYSIGQISVDQCWTDLERSWSRNRRRHFKRILRRVEQEGAIGLEVHDGVDPEEASKLLREGCEIEHRSWKGENGTSILSLPEIDAFFQAQVQELGKLRCLRFVFLTLKQRRIAFEYNWLVNGTVFTPKIGFDAAYAHLSPGILLEYLYFRAMYEEQRITAIDFMGRCPVGRDQWANVYHPVGNFLVTRPGAVGSMFVAAYRFRRQLIHWRGRGNGKRVPVAHDAVGASNDSARESTDDLVSPGKM